MEHTWQLHAGTVIAIVTLYNVKATSRKNELHQNDSENEEPLLA